MLKAYLRVRSRAYNRTRRDTQACRLGYECAARAETRLSGFHCEFAFARTHDSDYQSLIVFLPYRPVYPILVVPLSRNVPRTLRIPITRS